MKFYHIEKEEEKHRPTTKKLRLSTPVMQRVRKFEEMAKNPGSQKSLMKDKHMRQSRKWSPAGEQKVSNHWNGS